MEEQEEQNRPVSIHTSTQEVTDLPRLIRRSWTLKCQRPKRALSISTDEDGVYVSEVYDLCQRPKRALSISTEWVLAAGFPVNRVSTP